jgi:hypothetical protein
VVAVGDAEASSSPWLCDVVEMLSWLCSVSLRGEGHAGFMGAFICQLQLAATIKLAVSVGE